MVNTYSVESETRGGIEVYILRQGADVWAEVAPALGNNCFVFHAGQPVLEPVTFEEFAARPTSYGIPILFPFPNRIRDGVFVFNGQRYAVNPNRHGFVRDKSWRVTGTGASEQTGAYIQSSLDAADYADQILHQYPFPFRIGVTYRLKDGALGMSTAVQNTGENEMPCGFGIHPYFRRPERGTLQAPAAKRWELEDSLPTGNIVDVAGNYDLRQPKNIDELHLDDIFTDLQADSDGAVRCVLDDQTNNMQTVVEFHKEEFPHLVLYTPPAPRRAVCIEPYTCPTDAFNLRDQGIESSSVILLQPDDAVNFDVRFYTRSY
ncbi:MAG TPA: aldose 1-epimerase [Blastocatellia bacterium]|nr:aldose 1-epimerase [Blastocatellia bacterium]